MQRVLVTGGNGFIGYHVCKQLVKDKYDVYSFDNNSHWIHPSKSLYPGYFKKRMDWMKDNVKIFMGNTSDEQKVMEVLREIKPHYVIHLAALAVADVSNKYPHEARTSILQGTHTMLEGIRRLRETDPDFDFKRFTYTSSSMVYGDFKEDKNGNLIPAKEENMLDPKKSFYASFKVMGELITQNYGQLFDIPFTIIRPSAVYGPTDVNRRVSEIFVNNALTGKKLLLHNEGKTLLDFTYVKDTANGFILATTSEKGKNQIFNITAGNARSLEEFAAVLKKLIPKLEVEKVKITDTYRPRRGTLDISKAKKLLGYKPAYDIEKGLEEYVEYVVNAGVLPGILPEIKKKFTE